MIDFEKVYSTILMAEVSHAEQKRLVGEPYLNHLHRVAGRVSPLFPTTEALILSYLHDVVEDTPVTMDEIVERFGYGIGQGIFKLSQAKGEPRDQYLIRALASEPVVIAVKFADRCDNMMNLDQLGGIEFEKAKEYVTRYVDEVERFFLPVEDTAPPSLALELRRAMYTAKRLFELPRTH